MKFLGYEVSKVEIFFFSLAAIEIIFGFLMVLLGYPK